METLYMKFAILLILLSLGYSQLSNAKEEMKVYQCPRMFKVVLNELKLSPPEDLPEAKTLVHKLAMNGRINMRMGITFSGAGKCHYEGRNLDGSFFWGSLSVDDLGQVSSPFLLKVRSNEMQLLIPVHGFSTKGLNLIQEDVELFYKAKERGSLAVSIGSASIKP